MKTPLCDTCERKVACRKEGRRIVYFSCEQFRDIDEEAPHD